MTMNRNRIGIFDSGLGGLTVLSEVARLLPAEQTIYLGDTARVPYGIKSSDTVIRYALEDAAFLQSHKVKLIVIACNTASANAVEVLKKVLDVPVVGVIEPGARAAVEATRTGRIGIIGTNATIRSGAYTRAITEANPKAKTFTAACPLFVPLAEEGWSTGEITEMIAEKYLETLQEADIDTLVLGCTHYPLLTETIASVMGPDVTLIDSATATANEVARVLRAEGLENTSDTSSNDDSRGDTHTFHVTDSPESFCSVGARFLGNRGVRLHTASLAHLESKT
jgi:glutamate racemase